MTTIASVPESRSLFEAAHATLAAFAHEVGVRRARHAQRIALKSLIEMEPHRLADMGIDLVDVHAALARK